MKQLRLATFITVALALLTNGLLLLAPAPRSAPDAGLFKLQMFVVSSLSLNYFAAAIIFLLGVRDFKPEMRRPYVTLVISMAMFGLLNLQYPILLFAGFIPGPWVSYGGSIAVIIPGVIVHYLAARQFGRMVGVQSRWLSVPVLVLAVALTSAGAIALPHYHEAALVWFVVHQTAAIVCMLLNAFAVGIVTGIVKIIGPSFVAAFKALRAATALSAVCFLNVIIAANFGHDNAYTNRGATSAPFIVVSALYVITGYLFCKIRFYGLESATASQTGRGMLDAVIATARLASNGREIDPILDDVRHVTMHLAKDAAPSEADNQTLAKVYFQLEDYLLNRERLRTFTREELRGRLNPEARQVLQQLEQPLAMQPR